MDELSLYRLTPLEVWRMMNFTDEDFHKAEAVTNQGNLYKQAGNSIVVNVMVAIFGQIIEGCEDKYKEVKFMDGWRYEMEAEAMAIMLEEEKYNEQLSEEKEEE